jgi:hypothetical protein
MGKLYGDQPDADDEYGKELMRAPFPYVIPARGLACLTCARNPGSGTLRAAATREGDKKGAGF